jgi:hypothetical protein
VSTVFRSAGVIDEAKNDRSMSIVAETEQPKQSSFGSAEILLLVQKREFLTDRGNGSSSQVEKSSIARSMRYHPSE